MKTTFRTLIKTRTFLAPLIASIVALLALLVEGIWYIRPSDLQVPVRYSSFGLTNFYTEQWFYQFSFLIFGFGVLILHTLLAIRLYKLKGERFAVAFQWFTVVLLVLTVLTVLAIFRVADLS